MVYVHCHTNLDLRPCHQSGWPMTLPDRPVVGDIIRNQCSMPGGYHLELQVVRVTWYWQATTHEWKMDVELHLIPSRWESVRHFTSWYEDKK